MEPLIGDGQKLYEAFASQRPHLNAMKWGNLDVTEQARWSLLGIRFNDTLVVRPRWPIITAFALRCIGYPALTYGLLLAWKPLGWIAAGMFLIGIGVKLKDMSRG